YGGQRLALGWGDARAGEADVNVWGTTVPVDYALGCPNDTSLQANSTLAIDVPVTNSNPIYPDSYDYTLSLDRAWSVSGATGSVTVAENGATGSIPVSITIPDTARGTAHACLTVSLAGANLKRCCFAVTALAPAAVGDLASLGFGIRSASPNPAR